AEALWRGHPFAAVEHIRAIGLSPSQRVDLTLEAYPLGKSVVDLMGNFWTAAALVAALLLGLGLKLRRVLTSHVRTRRRPTPWRDRVRSWRWMAFAAFFSFAAAWAVAIVGFWWSFSSQVFAKAHHLLYALVPTTHEQAVRVALTKLALNLDVRNLWI